MVNEEKKIKTLIRIFLAFAISFGPLFLISDVAHANCVNPGQVAAVAAAQQNASTEPVVTEIRTCGGDDVSYQIPLTTTVTFDGVVYNNIYATTNSVITFGRPDGTYWTYPTTPSISLYSFDWVVYPQWRSDEHLIIRSSDGGFQVDISARPIWLQNTPEPTRIVITAAILSDGTVAMAYTLDGPEYPQNNPRTGVRLNNGQIVDFETYGIEETVAPPVLAPEPTEEAPFNPPPPPPPAPSLNAPTNVTATQLQDGSIELTWDAPIATSTSVERYAVSWSTDNFTNNGWGIASTTNSITIPRESFQTTGGLDQTYQFRIRSDNDTLSIYSPNSELASTVVASPPPPAPVIPDGATVTNENSFVEIVAPEGQRIASATGYYGDPNNGTRGVDVSSILFELLAGETSATIEVSNSTFQADPAEGTPKVLILLIVYENIPVDTTPQPVPEQPVAPEPTPLPEEETPIEPSPEPTPDPPTEEPTPEPTPSEEPSEEPTENEPNPLPEPDETETPTPVEPSDEEPITSAEDLPLDISAEELMSVDLNKIVATELTVEQAEALKEAALEVFETAEPGSPEYEQALEALMVAAQQDDIVLDESLAAIPLLGDVLGEAIELINFLGNAGADMSPQVREQSEKVVVTAIVAVQAALSAISISGIATTVNLRNGA